MSTTQTAPGNTVWVLREEDANVLPTEEGGVSTMLVDRAFPNEAACVEHLRKNRYTMISATKTEDGVDLEECPSEAAPHTIDLR